MRSIRPLLSASVVLGAALAAACGGSALERLVGTPAYQVYITPGTPQKVAQGDSVYFDISNDGLASAYLPRCGSEPAVDIQVFQNGAWQSTPGEACPQPTTTTGPVEIQSGQEIVIARLFTTSGKYRAVVSVATKLDLSDAIQASTVAFTIP